MNSLFRPLYEWFGYSGRERRASLILLFLIVIVMILRYSIPEKRVEIKEFQPLLLTGASVSETILPDAPAKGLVKNQKSGKLRSGNFYQLKKIELNLCDSAELERLPGIGPVLSARIIKYRNLLGGYISVSQLKEVYGLRDSTYTLISGRLTADPSLIRKININTAGFNELNRHPYIERYEAQAILKFRELSGRIDDASRLVEEKILTGEKAQRIRPYLSFE